ncbi:acetyltransferase [Verrucomicrobiales bacterium]|nr:acetyltransferase [Verrucomicrobiales bacterium]
MKKIIIIGAGGHSKVLIDIIQKEAKYKLVGLIDDYFKVGSIVMGYEVIGNMKTFNEVITEQKIYGGVVAFGDNYKRSVCAEKINSSNPNFCFVNCIHPKSTIGENVLIGVGNVFMAGTIINSGSIIENHCILNTNSSLDHDCLMSNYSSIAPNVTIGGNVKIGKYSAIGIGTNVFHKITIGQNCIIGGGSLVTNDAKDNSLYYGSPCQFIRKHHLGTKYM